MSKAAAVLTQLGVLSALLLGLPLLGVALSGQPLAPYLEFPPLTERVSHPPFEWTAFWLTGLLVVALLAGLGYLLLQPREATRHAPGAASRSAPLPIWGKAAMAWLLIAWWLAWNQAEWSAPLQPFKFPLLWLGYIGLVNAWAQRRSGACPWRDHPLYFMVLFPFSALFWWYFEYLNRFVNNWRYLGVDDYTAAEYVLYSTLAFSTVLPAVMSTVALLQTFPIFQRPRRGPVLRLSRPRILAAGVLMSAALGLTGIPLWPDLLFPLLWSAPLLVIVALQTLMRRHNYFARLTGGDWRVVVTPACAALVCGVFWELWNYYSWPKWSYSLPWLHRFELFEMPLLGYAGYLPFGLECAVAGDLVQRAVDGVRSRE